MAKRFQPFNDYTRGKKPKLDITVGRQRKDAESSSSNKSPHAGANQEAAIFWDDDDDDVILLATQVAESKVNAVVTESEITFSEFAPNLQGTTSTQQLLPPPASKGPAANPLSNDILSAMFDDDDDFAFLVMGNKANHEPDPFKKPLPTSSKSEITTSVSKSVEVAAPLSTSQSLPSVSGLSQSAARRQLASERQMKFLMDRVDTLKKDNAKLQNELSDSKEQMMCKSGEASLLRDELRHLKQQVQTLRMEKMMVAETARSECKTKLDEMSKKMNAKETELKMRDFEYSMLRMKRANETRNLEMSMANESMAMVNISEAVEQQTAASRRKKEKNARTRRQQIRLSDFDVPDEPDLPVTDDFDILCLTDAHQDSCSRNQRTLLQLEVDELEKIHTTLQKKSQMTAMGAIEIIKERIVVSACKVFPEFWSYVFSLEYPKKCITYPYEAYSWSLDKYLSSSRLLTQSRMLFVDEMGICFRRYVAILALMCKREAKIATSLIHYKHGEYLLLQIANDAIEKLGYSKEKTEHLGILEAFGALLHSILLNCDSSLLEPQQELLFDLLKQLVFTCPNAWVFREISACMLASTRHATLLEQCCVNSTSSSFSSDRVRSTYRFSEDSCLLQVYAGLLEIQFFSDKPLHIKHFELLAAICGNHVRFVYNCLMTPPQFFKYILSACNDIDVESEQPPNAESTDSSMQSTAISSFSNNSTNCSKSGSSMTGTTLNNTTKSSTVDRQNSTEQQGEKTTEQQAEQKPEPNCECYVKLCLSLVTLVYQLLRQWVLTDKKFGTAHVAEISQLAVHVLNIIFCEYYIILLFRDSEETTKHYLSLICTWWSENSDILEFKELHMNLLSCLLEAHFMLKPIHSEGNLDYVDIDLTEWKRLVKNAEAGVDDNASDPEILNPLAAENTAKFFDGFNDYAFDFK